MLGNYFLYLKRVPNSSYMDLCSRSFSKNWHVDNYYWVEIKYKEDLSILS